MEQIITPPNPSSIDRNPCPCAEIPSSTYSPTKFCFLVYSTCHYLVEATIKTIYKGLKLSTPNGYAQFFGKGKKPTTLVRPTGRKLSIDRMHRPWEKRRLKTRISAKPLEKNPAEAIPAGEKVTRGKNSYIIYSDLHLHRQAQNPPNFNHQTPTQLAKQEPSIARTQPPKRLASLAQLQRTGATYRGDPNPPPLCP